MTQALTIITDAYVLPGLLGGEGEALSSARADRALRRLNGMLGSWATDSLFCKEIQEAVATVGPGSTFTVGPTGNVVTSTNPVRLEEGCFFRLNNIDYPVELVEREVYMSKAFKSVATIRPYFIYYDPGPVFGTCYVYPSILGAMQVHLQVLAPLTSFPDLTTDVTLPPGYQDALTYSLAEILCIGHTNVDPQLAKTAMASRQRIRNANSTVPVLGGYGGDLENIYTGFFF